MRLPYAPTEPPTAADAGIYEAISARRAPRPLQSLDLTLLHAPPIASGWNSFLGAIRTQSSLPPALRELAICRVAVLNGAAYEWGHHAPLLKEAGMSEWGLETVRDEVEMGRWGKVGELVGKRQGGGLNEKEWAILDYTDQMTRGVKVEDKVFERLRAVFDEKEVVEITATVAAYNCVSRFLVALDVGESNGKKIE